uniref:melanoma-associated antigen 10-like n=1 Tax=Jaculus jaculus TaxID=51337 RepID=UPI001E1B55FA|nr:melanoma-associated antigen 10-like [Jaculus jaculus]
MSCYGKRPRLSLEEDLHEQAETEDLGSLHLHTAELEEMEVGSEKKEEKVEVEDKEKDEKIKEEEMEDYEDEVVGRETKTEGEEHANEEDDNLSSISFSSFNVSLPSGSPPSPFSFSSSSCSTLFPDTPEDNEGNSSMMLSIPQNPQSSLFSSSLWNNLNIESSNQEEENSGSFQPPTDAESLLKIKIKEKATDLVFQCLFKYRVKEPITEEEILKIITKEYENYFHDILSEASKYMEMTFGLDIKENDLISRSYIVVNSLNLTYEDNLNDGQRMPRNVCLILILGVIFVEGNCASEERIWEFLNMIEMYDGETHIMYGEPREFLTKELVEQNYLVYQQVPNTHPPCFQFLWGARAHAETTKMKVLEFFAKVNGCDPTSFPLLYEEALKEEMNTASVPNSPSMFSTDR